MRSPTLCNALLATALVILPRVAAADVITDWNEKAAICIAQVNQAPFVGTRTMAIVHTAMFDAVNSIEGGYAPYKVKVPAAPGSSAEAAAAAAAHAALVKLFPDLKAMLDSEYAKSLSSLPDPGQAGGVAVGEKVAAQILALRASDGAEAPNTYRPVTSPGVYVATTLPVASQWAGVKPWAMEKCSQFRPGPPPALMGSEWARDYNEIKTLGAKNSTSRTPEQTTIARFWTVTGPASWDALVRQLAAAAGRKVIDNARLFAMVEMAAADAYISIFDAKYTFNFWRPITAIRNGDLAGNKEVARVDDWQPLVDTPMHPEYPCAHCITSAAVATVLEAEFGTGTLPLSMTSPTAPGVVRKWTTLKEYTDEVSAARVYGGIHYRNSTLVGQAMGRKVGELVVHDYLTPSH